MTAPEVTTAKPEPAWIPIPARAPLELCKSCSQGIYWSFTELGRPVPVSIAFDGSIAPTRYDKGRGKNHFIDCPTRDQHRKSKVPRQTELLGIVLAFAISAACSDSTKPARDPNCFYPGDTIGLLKQVDRQTRRVVECTWFVVDHLICDTVPAGRLHSHCMVGDSVPPAARP